MIKKTSLSLSLWKRIVIFMIIIVMLYFVMVKKFRKYIFSNYGKELTQFTTNICLSIGSLSIIYYFYIDQINYKSKVNSIALKISDMWNDILLYLDKQTPDIPNIRRWVLSSIKNSNETYYIGDSLRERMALAYITSKIYSCWLLIMEIEALCGCPDINYAWLFDEKDFNKNGYMVLYPLHTTVATLFSNPLMYKRLIETEPWYPKEFIAYINSCILKFNKGGLTFKIHKIKE